MKDIDRISSATKYNYCVYLYKLDIDQFGLPIQLDCDIEKYLLYHIILFDEVILQTSAILKSHCLFNQFLKHEDIFMDTINGHHLIFPYQGKNDYSSSLYFEEYLNKRFETIGDNKNNCEIYAYKKNRAEKIAKELDSHTIKYMRIANFDTDSLFRLKVIESGKLFLTQIDPSNKVFELFSDFAKGEEAFQTFSLLQKTQMALNISGKNINTLGDWLRNIYYDANACATQCLPNDDIHVSFLNIVKYVELTGLKSIITNSKRINSEIIKTIKGWNCYRYLQTVYFNCSSEAINQLYMYYQYSQYRTNYYKDRNFYYLCVLYSIDYDSFVKSISRLNKLLDELLKRR